MGKAQERGCWWRESRGIAKWRVEIGEWRHAEGVKEFDGKTSEISQVSSGVVETGEAYIKKDNLADSQRASPY